MKINRLGLFLTRRCNFQCIYCCVQVGKDPVDKLTFTELQNLLLQAKDMGANRLVIAGEGEPLLDENFFSLVDYACRLGMACDLASNISLVDRDVAQRLFGYNIRLFAKLNSLNHVVQDKLAGKEHCHTWVDYTVDNKKYIIPVGLKNLLEAGYGGRRRGIFSGSLLVIETVITTLNIADIPEIVKFCKACGLGVYIEKLLPPTSSAFNRELIPSKEQELKLYKEVASLMDWKFRLITRLRCPFETDPFIDISGNIRFCFSIDKSAGNIRSVPLRKLHFEQVMLKDKMGKKSPVFRLKTMGFRDCRSRRLLRNEYNWQC